MDVVNFDLVTALCLLVKQCLLSRMNVRCNKKLELSIDNIAGGFLLFNLKVKGRCELYTF
jgi:hypothetical protein